MRLHKPLGRIVFPAFGNLVWRLPRPQKTVYLTFDDGPDPEITGEVLRILADSGAPATFFLSGEKVHRFRHHLDNLDYGGMQIGNHGFFHRPLFFLSQPVIEKEIRQTGEMISGIWGITAKLFRPPYGIFGPGLRRSLDDLGNDLILWSLMSNDFKWPAEKTLDHLKANLQPGDIVVFHDSRQSAATMLKVLPGFLDFCKSEGYQFLLF